MFIDSNQLVNTAIAAVIAAIPTAIALYIGLSRGTGKTIDIALDKLEKRSKESPTIQRLIKMMEMSDKLFGDKQAVEQMTSFFKEARELVTSPEAKAFFKNATEALKEFSKGSNSEGAILKLPNMEEED